MASAGLYASLHLIPDNHANIPPLNFLQAGCPSLTGDINAQSSYWNNEKVKIAYNSAYIQTETFNFTFAQHAIIVYVYLCSNFQEITMPNA